MRYIPKPEEELVNYGFESPIKSFFILILGFSALVVALTLLLGFTIEPILLRVSSEWEHSLLSWGAPNDAVHFPEGEALLEELIGAEAEHFSVYVLCSEIPNAMAAIGNNILITSGLLSKLKNKNSLSFILGHEFGHFKNRDHVKGMGWTLAATIVLHLFSAEEVGSRLVSQQLLLLKRSRAQEAAADKIASDLVERKFNGLDGAVSWFPSLDEATYQFGDISLFSTHPDTPERIALAKSRETGNGTIVLEDYRAMAQRYCETKAES